MQISWIESETDNEIFFVKPLKKNLKRSASIGINEEKDDTYLLRERLKKMTLLYDVPFAYLAESKMLNQHEIKFFHLDSEWVRTLLDGACSIGRNASVDYSNDITFLNDIYNEAVMSNSDVRKQLQGKYLNGNVTNYSEQCTGFLLKSPLVKGWRGLEFKAYSDILGKTELTALRIETLSNDVLIGLFGGELKRLDIKEPPESFHFGFTKFENKLKKRLRSIETGIFIKAEIEVAERGNRVINFAETAKNMGECKELFVSNSEVTSAHVALEMIQNPYMLKVMEE